MLCPGRRALSRGGPRTTPAAATPATVPPPSTSRTGWRTLRRAALRPAFRLTSVVRLFAGAITSVAVAASAFLAGAVTAAFLARAVTVALLAGAAPAAFLAGALTPL